MIDLLQPVTDLPESMRGDVVAINREIAPLEVRLKKLNPEVIFLATEELRLRMDLDTADNEPQPSDFDSGAEFGEAKWRWDAETDGRAQCIVELMGTYAIALFRLRDFIRQEVDPLEESLASLRERRKNTFETRMNLVKFATNFADCFAPAASAPESEGLLYHAGRAEGPTNMRPDPAGFPIGTEFFDTTLHQIIRAENGKWLDRHNRAV